MTQAISIARKRASYSLEVIEFNPNVSPVSAEQL